MSVQFVESLCIVLTRGGHFLFQKNFLLEKKTKFIVFFFQKKKISNFLCEIKQINKPI
jgi:hypothetical protein